MKKVKVFVMMVALVFLLGACAPVQGSSAVQVPEALQLAFGALVLAGVMAGLQALFSAFGLDLRGLGAALAATVTAFALGIAQGWIDVIPAEYDQLVAIALNIVLVILAGLGYVRLVVAPKKVATLFQGKE